MVGARYYKPGDPWYVCDRCGIEYRQSRIEKEWTNAMVCYKCYDPRHPQLDVKSIKEKINVKDSRPAQEERFLSVGDVTADDL